MASIYEAQFVKTRSFAVAKMAVEGIILDSWGEPVYTLVKHSPGFYIVTKHGLAVGKGVTYEVAIADFESNENPRWQV